MRLVSLRNRVALAKRAALTHTGFPGASVAQNPPANAGDARDLGSIPGLRRSPGCRKWQPTPVFLSGKLHGLTPCGCKESDTTEHTHTHTHTHSLTNDSS